MQTTIEFKPLNRGELKAVIKDFPKPRRDQQLFTDEFRILLNAYDPGLPGLDQLVHMVFRISDDKS